MDYNTLSAIDQVDKLRREEEEALSHCTGLLVTMLAAVERQRNISMDVKKGLAKLEKSFQNMKTLWEAWKLAE